MLKFFMGKNTPERQEYIIRNLRFEHELVDGEGEEASDDSSREEAAEEMPKDSSTDSEAA